MSINNQHTAEELQFNSANCKHQYHAIETILKTSTSNAETLERVRLLLNESCSAPSIGGVSYSAIRNPSLSEDAKNYLCEQLNRNGAGANKVIQLNMTDVCRDVLDCYGFMYGELSDADELVLSNIAEEYLEFDENFTGVEPASDMALTDVNAKALERP